MTEKNLVILLHGVGSNGANLAALGQAWAPILPGMVFESPDAPFPFAGGGAGRQWFSLAGITAEERPARIAAARPAFDAVLEALIEKHGLAGQLDRVALVGFSQGSMMALDAVASGRWPVAALVAYSGRLSSPGPLTPSAGTPVLLLHGADDTVVPASESPAAAETLRGLGVQAESRVFPGLGHTIGREGAMLGAQFLKVLMG